MFSHRDGKISLRIPEQSIAYMPWILVFYKLLYIFTWSENPVSPYSKWAVGPVWGDWCEK